MTFDHGCWLSNASVAPGRLYKYRVDLNTKTIQRTQMDSSSSEFPTVHPFRATKKMKYTYLMANARSGQNLPYRDVIKCIDTGRTDFGNTVNADSRQVWYSDGCIGEPVFAPRSDVCASMSEAMNGDEDDGFVLVQYYNPTLHLCEFVVLDAKQVHKGPVARIRLRHHIPYGFHGTFTPHVFVSTPLYVAPATEKRVRSKL